MRVMYLCAKHPPYDGRIHYKICNALKNKGYVVVNVHPNIEDTTDNGIKLVGYKQKPGFKGRLKSIRAMLKAGEEQKPDVIFAPEPDSLVAAYLLKRKNKNVKVIFDCHEWYNVHFTHIVRMKNVAVAKALNKLTSFIMHFVVKRIEAVITVNDTMTEYFKKYNSSSYSMPSIMSETYEVNFETQRKDFIYFGHFCNGGQEIILLDAARILKKQGSSARIVIIGGYHPTEKDLLNNFISTINKEQLQANIHLEGWLPKEEAFKLLNQGLVGIMRFDTCFYNGLPALPNKIFEYMAVGMAIICSGINGEQKRIIESEKCGVLIDKETGEDLAKAILYLYENTHKCLEMGRNAYKATQQKYNWDNYGAILDGIIKNC